MVRGARLGRSLASVALGMLLCGACSSGSDSGEPAPIASPDRLHPPAPDASPGSPDAAAGDAGDDGSFVNVTSCTNRTKDGDETDVDCGGSLCAACANGRSCLARRDCTSLVCAAGKCSADVGCSDGTREGFGSLGTFADIAACSGGWSVGGVLAASTATPACDRLAGNDGANANGTGCNVSDLCQIGWHVCAGAAEVGAKSAGQGCAGAAAAGLFFVTRESGPGNATCGSGANDLFGCGGVGAAPDPATCAPLDRTSSDLCSALPAPWSCGADDVNEANAVTKGGSAAGGVLCCRD